MSIILVWFIWSQLSLISDWPRNFRSGTEMLLFQQVSSGSCNQVTLVLLASELMFWCWALPGTIGGTGFHLCKFELHYSGARTNPQEMKEFIGECHAWPGVGSSAFLKWLWAESSLETAGAFSTPPTQQSTGNSRDMVVKCRSQCSKLQVVLMVFKMERSCGEGDRVKVCTSWRRKGGFAEWWQRKGSNKRETGCMWSTVGEGERLRTKKNDKNV